MPQLITAVALNPAIDRTVLAPGFRAGATNRVASSRLDPGGKGINVARVARALGAEVQVLGFLGEDNAGLILRSLSQQGIRHEFVPVPGENRVNLKIIDPGTGELTELNDTGFSVTGGQVAAFVHLLKERLPGTAVLVLAGSLPQGVPATLYRELIHLAHEVGVPAILDADGEPLRVALEARPTLIKPNREEAERLLGRPLVSRGDVVAAARELLARGPAMVAVSSGAEGAALVTPGDGWWATPPAIRPGSTVGAGDAMVAGFAVALARGLPLPEALRLATAAAAATARMEGTQVCSADAVATLLPEVTVTPYHGPEGEV
ncbi:MAG: 1-phosphofructokinase [Bacillota bacterium]